MYVGLLAVKARIQEHLLYVNSFKFFFIIGMQVFFKGLGGITLSLADI